jgi:hypothetical protein
MALRRTMGPVAEGVRMKAGFRTLDDYCMI